MLSYGIKRLLLVALVSGAALMVGAVPASTPASAQTGTGPVPVLPTGICSGVVSYTAATSSAAGTLTIGTTTFTIAPGATITGGAALTAGASGLCFIPGPTNAAGQITGGTVLPETPVTLIVCGNVTAFTAGASLTIGGIQFTLASPAPFTGGTPTVGQNQEIALTINPLGLVTGGAVAATATCAAGTTTVQGPFTTFVAPTATAVGTLTIGASTFFVAAGTNITATHSVPLAARQPSGHRNLGSISFHRAE